MSSYGKHGFKEGTLVGGILPLAKNPSLFITGQMFGLT